MRDEPRSAAGEPPERTTPPSSGQPKTARRSDEGSSTGSRAASHPFLRDPGPSFDAEAAQTAAAATEPAGATLHELRVEPVLWREERVRTLLQAQGSVTHTAIGVGETDWLWRDHELDAAADPLTQVLNKHPVTAAAAGASDELALMVALAGYVGRSIRERQTVLRELEEQEDVPITGRAPEPVPQPGPPPPEPGDIEWQTQ